MAGIYIVDVFSKGRRNEGGTRSIVIAGSAKDAGEPYDAEGREVEVGRIGTYDPGITGAQLAGRFDGELVIGAAPR